MIVRSSPWERWASRFKSLIRVTTPAICSWVALGSMITIIVRSPSGLSGPHQVEIWCSIQKSRRDQDERYAATKARSASARRDRPDQGFDLLVAVAPFGPQADGALQIDMLDLVGAFGGID